MSSVFLLALSDNPSSKQSRSLAEELGKAVEIMGKGKNGIGFGKVDVTVEKELQKEFDVKKAPELKLFFEGNRSQPISCEGNGICVSIKGMLTMETQKSAFQWLNRITSLCLGCTKPSCSQGWVWGFWSTQSFKDPSPCQPVALSSPRTSDSLAVPSVCGQKSVLGGRGVPPAQSIAQTWRW